MADVVEEIEGLGAIALIGLIFIAAVVFLGSKTGQVSKDKPAVNPNGSGNGAANTVTTNPAAAAASTIAAPLSIPALLLGEQVGQTVRDWWNGLFGDTPGGFEGPDETPVSADPGGPIGDQHMQSIVDYLQEQGS